MGAEEPGVAVGEDAAVRSHQPVAAPVGGGRHTDDGLVECGGPLGAEEPGVALGEDPTVGGHQPVAHPVWGGRHTDDGLVEHDVAGRTVEPGVALGEDPAVRSHQPVTLTVGGGRHAHDRLVEHDVAGRAEEAGVALGEDAAVGSHQPVAPAVGRHCHAHDGLVEHDVAGRTVERRAPVGEDAAVGGHQVVPRPGDRGRQGQGLRGAAAPEGGVADADADGSRHAGQSVDLVELGGGGRLGDIYHGPGGAVPGQGLTHEGVVSVVDGVHIAARNARGGTGAVNRQEYIAEGGIGVGDIHDGPRTAVPLLDQVHIMAAGGDASGAGGHTERRGDARHTIEIIVL